MTTRHPVPGISKFGIIVIGAILIALLGARPYASSWNDGSRLASVESLVDRHTWAIDDSIFVKVPPQDDLNPYSPDLPSSGGTMDKLLIGGHFYSSNPPVVTLYLAGVYWLAQKLSGLTAAQQPHAYVYLMTVASSGIAYVAAVLCIWFLAVRLGLDENASFLMTLSFALATLAPVYSRQVNNHVILLAAVAAIFLVATGKQKHAALLGLFVGFAYVLDLGFGPVLVLASLIYCWMKWRDVRTPALCAAAMLPFAALHHWLNYRTGGTFAPANSNVQYAAFPGSAFTVENMTGIWAHHYSIWDLVQYCFLILIGPHGFLLFNLPLLLLPVAAVVAWRSFPERRAELMFGFGLSAGVWALYSVASNNYSGVSSSIRWFVPLLVPAYLTLMLMLRARPDFTEQFKVLTQFGVILTAALFWIGPFRTPEPIVFWGLVILAVMSCAWSLRRRSQTLPQTLSASV